MTLTELLARVRWTVVESYQQDGARYIVARADSLDADVAAALTARERQALGHVASGDSTKEAAYAMGISDVTVRVLLGRAASKLGVQSRQQLLAHPAVRSLASPPTQSDKHKQERDSMALKVTTGLKGGRIGLNHNRRLAVTTGLKGGRIGTNHNRRLAVTSGLKGGRIAVNHNRAIR